MSFLFFSSALSDARVLRKLHFALVFTSNTTEISINFGKNETLRSNRAELVHLFEKNRLMSVTGKK